MRLPVLVIIASLTVALVQAGDGPIPLTESTCYACHQEGSYDPPMEAAIAIEDVRLGPDGAIKVTLRNPYTHVVDDYAILIDATRHQELPDANLPPRSSHSVLEQGLFSDRATALVLIPPGPEATVKIFLEEDPLGRERTIRVTPNDDRLKQLVFQSPGNVEFTMSGLEAAIAGARTQIAGEYALFVEVTQDFGDPVFSLDGEVLVSVPDEPRTHVAHVPKSIGPGESWTYSWEPPAPITEAGTVMVDLISGISYEHEAGPGIDDSALISEGSPWAVGGAGPEPIVHEETTPMPIWAGLAGLVAVAMLRRG